MSSSNWKDSRLKRAEETGSRSTYSWPPPRRTLSFISRLSLFPAYKVNSRTTTTHTCIPLITFEEQRESPSKTIFESPSMGRRKTANCTFKFSFPLLPPPPLLTLSPKLEEDRSNKDCADKPSCGFIRVAQCRSRFVEERLVSSRGIYITRGYWRAFLTRRQNIDTTTSARYCCSPCPPVTSTISTGNRRYLRNVARKR